MNHHSYPRPDWSQRFLTDGSRALRFRPGERPKTFLRLSEILQKWADGDISEVQTWERVLMVIRRAKARGADARSG